MAENYTARYRLRHFENGEIYEVQADHFRFQTIENQIEAFMSVIGGGVVRGWEVVEGENSLEVQVTGGVGIIPFKVREVLIQEAEVSPNKFEFVNKIDKIFSDNEAIKYVGVKTNNTSETIEVPPNTIALLYIGLSEAIVDVLQDPNSSEVEIDFTASTSLQFYSIPDPNSPVGIFGPYRNTIPLAGTDSVIEYPIYRYKIEGDFSDKENQITIFVNGKPYYQKHTLEGNIITFDWPLQLSDIVTVRVEPKFSLILAEIETSNDVIVRIDNSVRTKIFDVEGNRLLHDSLLEHVHNSLEGSPEKILLTTETNLINYTSTVNNKTYTFSKQPIIDKYNFNFGYIGNSSLLNYEPIVYINGVRNTESVTISDTGSNINVIFSESLEDSDIVSIKLRIKDQYTQITGKIEVNDSNPSAEQKDINLDASIVSSGTLDPDMIPTFSHIGIYQEELKPANPTTGEEYVHRTETKDYLEYFPILLEKSNARECKDIFLDFKSTNEKVVYACGSSGALYYNAEFSKLMGIKPEEFFTGWNSLTFDRSVFNENEFNEFDEPFSVLPLKRSTSSNNYDEVVYFTPKFIYSVRFVNAVPQIREIANMTSDKNITETDLDSFASEIQHAVSCSSLLNLGKSAFVAASNQVFLLDERGGRLNWWSLTTENPLWDSLDSLTNISEEYSEIESDVLFVGAQKDSDYKLYVNPVGFGKLESRVSSSINGGLSISNFQISPSTIWDFSTEDKSLIRSETETISDDIILSTYNGVSERLSVKSVSYSGTSTPSSNAIYFEIGNGISNDYEGKSTEYNSLFIRDWVLIAEGFSSAVKKVLYYNSRLFIVTEDKIYHTEFEEELLNSYYLCNSLSSLYTPSNLTEVDFTLSAGEEFSDAIVSGENLLVGTNKGIYKLTQTAIFPIEYTLESTLNDNYGTTLNDLLYPVYRFKNAYSITGVQGSLFVLSKYGIFYSRDSGSTWRNTIQIIGGPEDYTSPFSNIKASVRVVDIKPTQNRLYVERSENPYFYGYGYGYLDTTGYNYFDVIGFSSNSYGFAKAANGWGYGNELINPVETVESNDWIRTLENSGTIYDSVPLKIVGVGLDNTNNFYYIDIEQADGNAVDFTALFRSQILNIYSKVVPLGMIEGIPQDSNYGSTDVIDYSTDYYRQSITFSQLVDYDDIVLIASQYKAFTNIKSFDNSQINDANTTIEVKNYLLTKDADWTLTSGNNVIETIYGFNKDDILKITVRGLGISGIGQYDHSQIEDQLSLETMGLEYRFDGVRSSNMLLFMMSVQHLFENDSFVTETLKEGTIEYIQDPVNTENGYIEDSTLTFLEDELLGKDIILNSDENSQRFAIISNDPTTNRIYIQKALDYEDLSSSVDGTSKEFIFNKGKAVLNSVIVYVNGVISTDWSEVVSGSSTLGIEFITAPLEGDRVQVSYVSTTNNLLLTNIASIGQKYKIINQSTGPFALLQNTFISRYKDESTFIIDLNNSFIENQIYVENSTVGESIAAYFYSHYNSTSDYFFVASEKGIWRRKLDSIIYEKTSELLSTLDATGSISVPLQINGAYIQYNKDSKEWTVTWGGGSVSKENNFNLNKIKVNSIAVSNSDPNIVFIATDEKIFRSFDGGETLEVSYYISNDNDLSEYPECESIVIDEDSPWNVVCVFRDKLIKSLDYGSNWEDISGKFAGNASHGGVSAFSYQKDNSDSSSFYYYGRNNLFLEEYQNKSPISYLNDAHNRSRMLDRKMLFGPDFSDTLFTGIDNYKEEENILYLGSRNYGVFKSTIMGNSKNITLDKSRTRYSYGEVYSFLNQYTDGNSQTCAFNSVSDSNFAYDVYVDVENSRTYIAFQILPTERDVPEDGDFVGKYVEIVGSSKSFMKILEHYVRGPRTDLQSIFGLKGEYYERKHVEFVLDGVYPKRYDNNSIAKFVTLNNGDYYYPTGSLSDLKTMFIPLFSESNGIVDKIPLVNLEDKVYVTKSNVFNESEKETTAFIDFAPSYLVNKDLSGYYIGDKQSEIRYKVIESKVLTSGDPYYLEDRYGYGYGYGYGAGLNYFDILGFTEYSAYGYPFGYGIDTFESDFADSYGWGFGYALADFGLGEQIALRLEKKEGASDDFEFDYRKDPINLWYRYKFTELHNRDYKEKTIITDDNDSIIVSAKVSNNLNQVYVKSSDIFVSGHEQNVIVFRINTSSYTESYLDYLSVPGILIGKFVQNISTGNKHVIYDSVLIQEDDDNYDAQSTSLYLRVELYGSSKSESAYLFSDGAISSFTTNTLVLEKNEGLELNALKDLSIYFNDNRLRKFRIISNTSDTLTIDYNSLDSIINDGDIVNISGEITFPDVLDLKVHQNTGIIVISTFDGVFYSKDKGVNWRQAFSGLDRDPLSGIPYSKISKIFICGNYVYGVSDTSLYSGVFRFSLIDFEWEKIGGFSSDILNGVKVISVSVSESGQSVFVYVGSEEDSFYKGILDEQSGQWTWSNYTLNSVTAIDTITNHDDLEDMDRIWVGTKERGLFVKDEDQSSWTSFTELVNSANEIVSKRWRVWSVVEKDDLIYSSSLFRENESIIDLVEKQYVQELSEDYSGLFDWVLDEEKDEENDIIHFYTQDSFNKSYISQEIEATITSQNSRGSHRFINFTTNISGWENIYRNKLQLNGLSLFPYVIDRSTVSMYENPFLHLPDISSIQIIEETSAGNIILGTDRNGLFRSKSTSQNFILPNIVGDYSKTNFGFVFVSDNFTDVETPLLTYSRTYDDRNEVSPSFSYIWERVFTYNVFENGPSSNGYSELNSLDTIEDIIGSYIVFCRDNDIDEVDGGFDRTIFIIKDIEKLLDDSGYYKFSLTLTVGRFNTQQDAPSSRSSWGDIYSRWSTSSLPVISGGTNAKRFYIVDAEKFVSINTGLPQSTIKDENGNYEYLGMIRGISIDSFDNSASICLGINGVYTCDNIDSASIVWEEEDSLPEVDITSIVRINGDIFIGTWGDGVWSNRDGIWSSLSDMEHPYIWSLYLNDAEDTIYIGTEHGGIYTINPIATGTPVREVSKGVIRSQIFIWKTIGVPVRKSTGLDYSNSNKLISYSWGGGIFQSIDSGSNWSQINTGLENYYIQDISICPDNPNVAYAATFGGGVFRTSNLFTSRPLWNRTARENLPLTLNVDEVEVGTNENILYIKVRENDLSYKNIPYKFRYLSRTAMSAFAPAGISSRNEIEVGELKDSNNRYLPISSYSRGIRKHTIYRSEDGGLSWDKVYDKEPSGENYSMSSMIFDLIMVPGESDVIHFISKYFIDTDTFNSNREIVDRIDYVKISNGQISSELAFASNFELSNASWGGLSEISTMGDANISINPDDVSEIYVSISNQKPLYGYRTNSSIILRSYDSGDTWDFSLSTSIPTESTEFTSRVQFSTIDIDYQELELDANNFVSCESGTIEGVFRESDSKNPNFYWPRAKELLLDSDNYSVTIRPNDNDIFNHTSLEQPIGLRAGARPFYLIGATVRPNTANQNSSGLFTITGGGNSTYLPSDYEKVTLLIDSEYTRNIGISQTNAEISNLTSIIFDYDQLPANSLLKEEDSLIAVDVSFSTDNFETEYKIAIHRYYESGGNNYIQLYIIGDVTLSEGDSVRILPYNPIFVPFYGNVMKSYNKGISWKHTVSTDAFSSSSVEIFGIVNYPKEYLTDASLSSIDRRIYILVKKNQNFHLYYGDVEDSRYDGEPTSAIEWTEISLGSSPEYYLNNGISLYISENEQYLFITQRYRIRRMEISDGIPSGSFTTVYGEDSASSNIDIQYPLVISEVNPDKSYFIESNRLKYTEDNFETTVKSYNLPKQTRGNFIVDLELGKDSDKEDTIFASVDSGQSINTVVSSYSGVLESFADNSNIIIVSTSPNPFLESNKWIGRGISIEDSTGNSYEYTTKITGVRSSEISLLNTLRGEVRSYSYNSVLNKTFIQFRLDGNIAEFSDADDYRGSIFTFQQVRNSQSSFYTGKVEDLDYLENLSFTLVITGNLSNIFTNRGIDFSSSRCFIRVGRLLDYMSLNSTGKISSTRVSDFSEDNGLYMSSTNGNGWTRFSGIFYDENDRPSGVKVYPYPSEVGKPQAKTGIVSSNNITRVLINDSWISSQNIKGIEKISDGRLLLVSSNGLILVDEDSLDPDKLVFSNYYYNNFKSVYSISNNLFILTDNENNVYIIEEPENKFYGNETVSPVFLNVPEINKVIEDEYGLIWMATEGGLYLLDGNNLTAYTIDNSDITSNSVKDIVIDNNNRMWLCLDEEGINVVDYVYSDNQLSISSWILYDSSFGFSGKINNVLEKNGLGYSYDGISNPATITLNWVNDTLLTPRSVLVRSKTNQIPILQGKTFSFNPISGQIGTVIEEEVDGISYWKITASVLDNIGTGDITENSLVGKYILINTRENDNSKIISLNSLNEFYVLKDETDIVPESGKYFMIAENVSGFDDTYILSVDVSTPASTTKTYLDYNLVEDQNYTYHLYYYSSNSTTYNRIESKTIAVVDGSQGSETSNTLLFIGPSGVFKYRPQATNTDSYFVSIGNIGVAQEVRTAFIDSNKVIWISVDNKVIKFISGDQTFSYKKNDLFSDNSNVSSDSMIVYDFEENENGDIIIATNVGLSIIKSDNRRISYINNDTKREFNDSYWRPVLTIDEEIDFATIFESSTSGRYYMSVGSYLYYTDNKGLSWTLVASNLFIDKISEVYSDASEIIDYIIVQNDQLYSSLSDVLEEGEILQVSENIPAVTGDSEISIPGHIYLMEDENNKKIYSGLYNNNIVANEREIAVVDFSTDLAPLKTPNYLGDDNGLSIQSVYCFEEIDNGAESGIFAGCKDNIIFKRSGENSWSIIPMKDDGEHWAYTSLQARADSSAFSFGSVSTDKALVYATRSNLYSSFLGVSDYSKTNIISLRYTESDIYSNLGGYGIKDHLFTGTGSFFTWCDDKGLNNYYIHGFDGLTTNLDAHRGALKFLSGKKVLLAGGFENTLYIMPFTSEGSSLKNKTRVLAPARKYVFGSCDLPQYSYRRHFSNYILGGYSLIGSGDRHSYGTFRLRPPSAWHVAWNSDNDQEGYCAFCLLGQNLNNPKLYYTYSEDEDKSWMMKTLDGGSFWQYFNKVGYPNGIVSNMVLDDVEKAISLITGDVGVYKFDSNIWSSYYSQTIPEVPVKVMSRIGADIYVAPLGFGLYKMARGAGGYGYGYGAKETLDYFDIISIYGTSYGFLTYSFDTSYAFDSVYGYGYGYEVVEDWTKFTSRFVTESGFNLAGWHVTSINEDPTNKNRVIIGTNGNGVFEGVYDNVWKWKDINFGLPSGNISVVKVLETDPFTIFAGVADSDSNDGLYVRRSGETSFAKITNSGIPNTSEISDIQIDKNIRDIYTTFYYDNNLEGSENLVILRSAFESPSQAPDNGISYQKGSQVFNAEVVYVGNDDFSTTAFVDDDKGLRAGIPYYYRFFKEDNLQYEEIGLISGLTTSVSSMGIVVSGTPFVGLDLTGKICRLFNRLNGVSFSFKIALNTSNTVVFEEDPFGIINKGTTDSLQIESEINYYIQSTIVTSALTSNPIFCVADGEVYRSIDNGRTWVKKNSGISIVLNSITPVIKSSDFESTIVNTTLYSTGHGKVYKSTDSGTTWNEVSGLSTTKTYKRVWVDTSNNNVIYVLESEGEVYRSIDGGSSWELASSSVSNDLNASDFVPDDTNEIYIGYDNVGLYKFTDSLRDKIYVDIESSGTITEFDIDYMEMGDKVYTDSNSILSVTLSKNDLISDTREQVRFKVSDETESLTFKFRKNKENISIEDIYIGSSERNPYSNPFVLENPAYVNDDIVINSVGNITESEIFAITNKGLYTTTNSGDVWIKENSAVVPSNIYDVGITRDGELLLATEGKGLWVSQNNRAEYRNVEQDGQDVRVIWETQLGGTRRVFRGGSRGLYVTVEKPASRTLIVYSGSSFEGGKSIEFSWGDLIAPNDGGWSSRTINVLNSPTLAFRTPGGTVTTYDGWDGALIVRRGPYSTFDLAESDALSNDIFAPDSRVQYPYNRIDENDRIFRTGNSTYNLEEIRDINELGDGTIGVTRTPQAFMSEGNIIVGCFNNPASVYPSTNNYPTTDDPIIDRVEPQYISATIRAQEGMPIENYADASAYSASEEKLPILKADRFYIYRIYPYRNVPSPDYVKGFGSSIVFPLHPRYLPSIGDLSDSYSYSIDIKKFSGATNITSVSSNSDGNWIVGTDVGIFWSNQSGMNVNKSQTLQNKVSTVFISSGGLVFVSVSGSTRLEVYKNEKDLTNSVFDTSWSLMSNFVSALEASGINRVYNFTEDENGNIYATTNKGIFISDSNAEIWGRADSVGDVESVRAGKALGQEFVIES